MKKILLSSILFLFFFKSNSQITLEHNLDSVTFGGQFYCTDIGNNEFKYVFLDTNINGFHLYNMDMSPFMTNIIIPSTDSVIKDGFTVIYVTRTLFDCDSSNIEYVFERPFGSNTVPFSVFRTDGTLLLQVDSARGPYCFGCYGGSTDIRPIQNTSDGAKLYLDKKNIQFGSGVLIYSVCGVLSVDIYDFSDNKSFVKIFPNPISGILNFQIVPPNNVEEFQLIVFDSNSNKIKSEKITIDTNYSLDLSHFNNGTYFYSLASKQRAYQTGKFILIK